MCFSSDRFLRLIYIYIYIYICLYSIRFGYLLIFSQPSTSWTPCAGKNATAVSPPAASISLRCNVPRTVLSGGWIPLWQPCPNWKTCAIESLAFRMSFATYHTYFARGVIKCLVWGIESGGFGRSTKSCILVNLWTHCTLHQRPGDLQYHCRENVKPWVDVPTKSEPPFR